MKIRKKYVYWIHDGSDAGGRMTAADMARHEAAGGEFLDQVPISVYVRWLKAGYDMEWIPPEWIIEIFD